MRDFSAIPLREFSGPQPATIRAHLCEPREDRPRARLYIADWLAMGAISGGSLKARLNISDPDDGIAYIRSIYIDNRANSASCIIRFIDTDFRAECPPFADGWFTVLTEQKEVEIIGTFFSTEINTSAIYFCNVSPPPASGIPTIAQVNVLSMPVVTVETAPSTYLDVNIVGSPSLPVYFPVIPAVTVSNTPAVTIANTPAVTVVNTPAVTVANTPAVTVANTPAVTVSNTPIVLPSHRDSNGVYKAPVLGDALVFTSVAPDTATTILGTPSGAPLWFIIKSLLIRTRIATTALAVEYVDFNLYNLTDTTNILTLRCNSSPAGATDFLRSQIEYSIDGVHVPIDLTKTMQIVTVSELGTAYGAMEFHAVGTYVTAL